MRRNTRFHTICSQDDNTPNPHYEAVHLLRDRKDLRPIGSSWPSQHYCKITPPEDVDHKGGMGRVTANGHTLRMNANLLRRTSSTEQRGLQTEHDHQGCHWDPAPWIL